MPIPSDYNYTATETGRRVSHNYNLQEIGGGLTEFNSALEEAAYRMKKLGLSIYEAIDPNVLARYCFESVGISEVLQQIRKDADRLEAAIKTNTGPTAPGPVENWLRTLKYLPDLEHLYLLPLHL